MDDSEIRNRVPATAMNRQQTQPDFFPAELIALERGKIASQNRSTDVARAAIDAQLEADKLEYNHRLPIQTSDQIG